MKNLLTYIPSGYSVPQNPIAPQQPTHAKLFNLGNISGFSSGTFSAPSHPITRFVQIVSGIISFLTIFAGLSFLIYLLLGSLNWMQGGQDQQKLEKAKKQISTAIIGLLITIAIITLTSIIGKITGFNILKPELIIPKILPQ